MNQLSQLAAQEKGGLKKLLKGFSTDPAKQQHKTFRKLLKKAMDTEFGEQFKFEEILNADYDIALYRKLVPIYTYETIYEAWWKRVKRGDKDTCWPGRVKYFALSSGTTKGASKIIPVSANMIKTIKKTSLKQMASLKSMRLPNKTMTGEVLLIGGCTQLEENNGRFFGDMSGISMLHSLPKWFLKKYYRPGYTITDIGNWNKRVEAIVTNAKKWNITVICGMPNWVHLILERIVAFYKVDSIHDIWPNLRLYVHGGVYFTPFKADFEALLKYPIAYSETYMASEGFFGFSTVETDGNIRLVLNGNVFFEFIPYQKQFFNENGSVKQNVKTLTIGEVQPNVNYAVVITNNSGAWRYLIGDTISFIDTTQASIKITGRIGKTLSVCGEHVTSANVLEVFEAVTAALELPAAEFTVFSKYTNGTATHHWFISGNKSLSKLPIANKIDKKLAQLNHDYAVARSANLNMPVVHIIPKKTMLQWMSNNGKAGNQYKMPVILSEDAINSWLEFTGIDI
jgi:hypothetical protein